MPENHINYPLRMPESLMEWLRQEAAKQRRSVNTLLILLVEQAKEQSTPAPTQQPAGQR
jgi:hypothetical protein